jgi:hypothetical protein
MDFFWFNHFLRKIMAHFAHVNSNGIVDQVIVIEADVLALGHWGDPAEWKQTSYNTVAGQHPDGRPIRKNFAGIGFTYDATLDAFIPPKPFASWVLNDSTCLWEAPIAYPTDGKDYVWSEETVSWVEPPAKTTQS